MCIFVLDHIFFYGPLWICKWNTQFKSTYQLQIVLLNKNRERLTRWWINGWTTKASGWRRWMVLHNEGTAFVGHVMTHDSGDGEISFWPRMLADERWRLPLLLPIHGRATHIFTSTDGQHDGWLTSIHLEIIWITANPKETVEKTGKHSVPGQWVSSVSGIERSGELARLLRQPRLSSAGSVGLLLSELGR